MPTHVTAPRQQPSYLSRRIGLRYKKAAVGCSNCLDCAKPARVALSRVLLLLKHISIRPRNVGKDSRTPELSLLGKLKVELSLVALLLLIRIATPNLSKMSLKRMLLRLVRIPTSKRVHRRLPPRNNLWQKTERIPGVGSRREVWLRVPCIGLAAAQSGP